MTVSVEDEEETIEEEEANEGAVDHQAELSSLAKEGGLRAVPQMPLGSVEHVQKNVGKPVRSKTQHSPRAPASRPHRTAWGRVPETPHAGR